MKDTLTADEIVIEAGATHKQYWRDLWRYRELFYVLSWRDVAVRYKQTVAGAAWALVQPIVNMVIMTVVFSRIAGLPSEGGAPYPIMVLSAMLPWQFFSTALAGSSQSVIGNAHLISKVYFPRLIVPATPLLVSLVDLVVASSALFGMMFWFGYWPTWRVIVLPGLVVLAMLAALGPSLILTALSVRYRDFRFIVPFVIQIGMYVTPVAYSSAIVRQRIGPGLFALYSLNPMVGVINGFRWALLRGGGDVDWLSLLVSCVLSLVLCAVGIAYFRRTERSFADFV